MTISLSKRRLEFVEEQARQQGIHDASIDEIATMCREILDLRRINHVEVLTPGEFARRLKLPAKTILELCRREAIPGARKIGRQWRIPDWAVGALFPQRGERR